MRIIKPYALYSIVFFTLISCARVRYDDKDVESVMVEEAWDYDTTPVDIFSYEVEEEASNSVQYAREGYKVMIKEKLQEYLDQKQLNQTHPDFRIGSPSVGIDSIALDSIKRISFISPFEKISDSVSKVQTQITFHNAVTDTIVSYITTDTITIDNVTYPTSKVRFQSQYDRK